MQFIRTPITLTYDDPKTYKGPIVEGWPPSKNRAITLYMQGIGFVQEILNLLLNVANYIYISYVCMTICLTIYLKIAPHFWKFKVRSVAFQQTKNLPRRNWSSLCNHDLLLLRPESHAEIHGHREVSIDDLDSLGID